MRNTKTILAVAAALAAACQPCRAGGEYFGTLVLTDGITTIPNAAVVTPEELSAVDGAAKAAESAAEAVASRAGALEYDAAALGHKVAALNGAQIIYGTIIEFGSETITATTNVSAVIVGAAYPSNTVETQYVELFYRVSEPLGGAPVPQVASSPGGAWADAPALETGLTTYPVGGVPVEVYRILLGVPAAAPSAFFRVRGELRQQAVGKTATFGEFTVNGVRGLTVTNGWGVFVDGLLVEELK